jgi:hypothetical protein
MTMPRPHPDDERLSAYAGGDRDALRDADLVAHLTTCDRCRPLVDELAMLRGVLAELPDLAPSRPLRLIPPVPAPAARGSWLRRLTAPAMATGAALILVGGIGIGATGGIFGFFGGAASAIFQNVGDNLQGEAPEGQATGSDTGFPAPGVKGSPVPSSQEGRGSMDSGASRPPTTGPSSPQASPTATPVPGSDSGYVNRPTSDEQPWLTLLIAGTGLFVISTALRFSLSPRAG